MSRGFLLELTLVDEADGIALYDITAKGCFPSNVNQPGEVATITIDKVGKAIHFRPMNGWADQKFFLPEFDEIRIIDDSRLYDLPINKSYGWWNVQLIRLVKKILNEPGYRKRMMRYE